MEKWYPEAPTIRAVCKAQRAAVQVPTIPNPTRVLASDKTEVERLADLGVLEHDRDSPWAFPELNISKKDNTVRFLTDFRRLNELLQHLGARLNATDTNVHPDARPPNGLLRASACTAQPQVHGNRAPLRALSLLQAPNGISTAPDEFQDVTDQLLVNLSYMRVYLDDILVVLATFVDDIAHLRSALQRLEDAGVVIHPTQSKCCASEVEYLGFKISEQRLTPVLAKVTAIRQIKPPKTRKQLRRFIGIVNFYREMWERRAHIMAPLTHFCLPKQPYKWTATEDAAFRAVKAMIAKTVVLAYSDFTKRFNVHTDLFGYQIGGVIAQGGKLIAFWSWKCTDAQ
ncbi:hypothetical protein PybrP1_005963, partial [[Pythium] brassicae (nom. inval.)]